MAQLTSRQTPRSRQDHQVNHRPLLLDRSQRLDYGLHQRLRDMPTVQKLDAQTENTDLSHPCTNIAGPFQTDHLKPHHQTTKKQ